MNDFKDIKQVLAAYDAYAENAALDDKIAYLNDAIAKREAEKPEDLLGISALYNELGSICRHNDRFQDAEKAFLKALSLMEQPIEVEGTGCTSCFMTAMLPDDLFGTYYTTQERTANYATIVNNLAGAYRMMGRYEDSIELFRRAWDIYNENPETPIEIKNSCMNNLALVYIDLRQLDKARECFMLILQPMEDWTAGSFELATTYGNLALVEALAHNKEKATEYVCKAEKIFADILSADDPTYQGIVQLKSTIEKM